MATAKTTRNVRVKDLSLKEQLDYFGPARPTVGWAAMQSCPHCGCDVKRLCLSGECENPSCERGNPNYDSVSDPSGQSALRKESV